MFFPITNKNKNKLINIMLFNLMSGSFCCKKESLQWQGIIEVEKTDISFKTVHSKKRLY